MPVSYNSRRYENFDALVAAVMAKTQLPKKRAQAYAATIERKQRG